MNQFTLSVIQTLPPDEQKRRLAAVYRLILSWSDPSDKETTGSEDFGETPEPVEETGVTGRTDQTAPSKWDANRAAAGRNDPSSAAPLRPRLQRGARSLATGLPHRQGPRPR